MKIAYLPIDERPCNITYVQMIAESSKDVELFVPGPELLGYKKKAANTEGLWNWLKNLAGKVDALILSIDMLVYGGLLPSRLHDLTQKESAVWVERLRSLRQDYPNLGIYASNLIMRTPKYSSSDEEPDYYEHWGRELFLRSYLLDKEKREKLTEHETKQLSEIKAKLPKEHIEDYETRRAFNSNINVQMLDLVKEGVLTFLSIPQDDSSEYGYTAIDQSAVVTKREQLRLYKKVHMYPGADEVGATLLSRVYNDLRGQKPKIFPIWSSTFGSQLVPMYEDRPFAESLKAHVLAAGCQLVDRADDADLILAYNTPGRVMQESWEQNAKDITYTSFRNMLTFVDQIKHFIDSGKKVIVSDSAYANGGDRELITLLDEEGILDKLVSYKGWNTNCNTLGTTICQGVLGADGKQQQIQENLIYHLFDDYFYQAEIRMEMNTDYLPKYDLNYFDLKEAAGSVNEERNERMFNRFNEMILHSFQAFKVEDLKTFAPWNRMFECGLSFNLKDATRKE
ncbi:hypothetical protein ABE65_018525 [Fictibacillus phosphorivorans]|uniref:DUF4127 family protein n=1 Tax=Fictibacillus phosphorivorans TaxID=1221500 RepID=A0A160IQJ6_9BACL|nr:DUF4127 family protein [Fictibacillus phosphorivorans]ANC78684.1 hypothetical protein ABE65_018525 [Fictibacillus phosphorivorans]